MEPRYGLPLPQELLDIIFDFASTERPSASH